MTTSAQLALDPVVVTPGTEATTSLTIRNDSDIVEAYELEVVGDCAAWSVVEPQRVSLYPGTSETVTVRLRPPRSPEVRAGRVPLGVRVQPVERPDSVVVPETTVLVEPFGQVLGELTPRRRRGWLGARYRVSVRNLGNAPADLRLTAAQAGEDLRFALDPNQALLEPGTELDSRLRVRVRRRIWFGKPVTWQFTVSAGPAGGAGDDAVDRPQSLPGELVQLPILPRWLLALLAAIIALIIAWFALVRPAVRSNAVQAAQAAANQVVDSRAAATSSRQAQPGGGGGAGNGATGGGAGAGSGGGSGGGGGGGGTAAGASGQSSATIEVQTGGGTRKVGTYTVPAGRVFEITDIVIANFQGDEGVLTISFGNRVITTIALETFRNQDYHWVTPIEVTEGGQVSADVTCAAPGTPATGRQAAGCDELLNVSGTLRVVRR